MRIGFLVIKLAFLISILGVTNTNARTRAPRTENEKSLLYWRYLCENQAQREKSPKNHEYNSSIEFECLSQNWKVFADGGLVREVVEDAKK